MRIINKEKMLKFMEEYPDGGIVFAEYKSDVLCSPLMVTDGDFGATQVIPFHAQVFDFDWNINEYRDDELFAIFDNNDILQMIQILVSGCKIELTEDYE